MERAALYAVALCCRWVEGRSRFGVPQEVRPVVPVTTSSPRLSFRARSSHCQVLAFPLTRSPEGGSQWCQITPGVPTPRLLRVCGCSCEWNMQHNARVRKCGWRWKAASGVVDSSSEATFFTKRVRPPCVPRQTLIHSKRRPTYASEYVIKRHEQQWLVAGNANVTSKSMASEMIRECVSTECTGCTRRSFIDTFTCKLPRRPCEGG